MRLFLSYRTADAAMAERLREALLRKRPPPALDIFRDREGLVLGEVWPQRLADKLAEADAVLLLLGRGLGPWQEREFQEALRLQLLAERKGRPRIIPITLMADAPLPGFAALYHRLIAPEPDADEVLAAILAALDSVDATDPTPDWRRINPYKGLAALTAADAAFFFGREPETATVLERIRERPGKVLTLVGNSGVGKSSLMQAGVIDALRTQRWPGTGKHDPGEWIGGLSGSHRWPAVTFRPGETPVLNLVLTFLGLVIEPSAALEREAQEWVDLMLKSMPLERLTHHIGTLLTRRTGEPAPNRYLIYVDQGEELYARSTSEQRTRFSALIAEAAARPEFQILSSLRADYYGHLQGDLVFFDACERIDLPPMSATKLARAIVEPARRLGIRFEPAEAPARLAELAALQPGALPLVSDLLAELWHGMEKRGDGLLSWRERTDLVDVGRPLSARADRYLAKNPQSMEATRKLFALHLAHVPPLGEAVRRRALQSEFSEEQWRIVETLSDQEWRLLTVSKDPVTHEPTVEVAHEQLLRSWTTLSKWLIENRDFLIWKAALEHARLDWLAAEKADDALLMGRALTRALHWRNDRESDLGPDEVLFIEASEAPKLRKDEEKRLQERQRMLEAQSIVIVQAARVALSRGDFGTALALALEALPQDVNALDRPYVPEAELVLQDIMRHPTKEQCVLRRNLWRSSMPQFSSDGARVAASCGKEARVWDASSGKELAVLSGHNRDIENVVFSPDGLRVLTSSADGTAGIWEATSGKELVTILGHKSAVLCAVFSRNGARVLTVSTDGTARLWTAAAGMELTTLRVHHVSSAVFSHDGSEVLTVGGETARLWHASSGQELAAFSGHMERVCSAVFSPDSSQVLTASDDGTARLWAADSGQLLAVLSGHGRGVSSAVFSPDGARVLTASSDRSARLWEAATGKELTTLRGHELDVSSAVFSPDGKRVLTASSDNTARLWETSSGKELAVLRGHEQTVFGAVFSPDGTQVLTASNDGTARLWDLRGGSELAILRGHGRVESAVFSPDGLRVLTASSDNAARLWTSSGKELGNLRDKGRATFSPDGARVLTGSDDGIARLWEAATGKQVAVLHGDRGNVWHLDFSPDGARVLSSGDEGSARIWEAASGKELSVLRGHERRVESAVFSPDGTRVLTASGDKTARIWDAATGKELAVLGGHDDAVTCGMYSPDGRHVVTVSETGRLWDVGSGKELAALPRPGERMISPVFSPDGAQVLIGTTSTVQLFETTSGKVLAVLRPRRGVMNAVFSPDGAQVLTTPFEGAAGIWETASGRELAVLRIHEGRIRNAVFAADGGRVLTALNDGTARLWDAAHLGSPIARG